MALSAEPITNPDRDLIVSVAIAAAIIGFMSTIPMMLYDGTGRVTLYAAILLVGAACALSVIVLVLSVQRGRVELKRRS